MKKKVTERDLQHIENAGGKVRRAKKKPEAKAESPAEPQPQVIIHKYEGPSAADIARMVAVEVAKIKVPEPKVVNTAPAMAPPIKSIVVTDIKRDRGGITDLTMNVEREELH